MYQLFQLPPTPEMHHATNHPRLLSHPPVTHPPLRKKPPPCHPHHRCLLPHHCPHLPLFHKMHPASTKATKKSMTRTEQQQQPIVGISSVVVGLDVPAITSSYTNSPFPGPAPDSYPTLEVSTVTSISCGFPPYYPQETAAPAPVCPPPDPNVWINREIHDAMRRSTPPLRFSANPLPSPCNPVAY
jgi:hypothetical protein